MTKWQGVMVAMNGTTKLVKLFHLLFQEDEIMVLSYLLRFMTASHCNQAKNMTFLCVY